MKSVLSFSPMSRPGDQILDSKRSVDGKNPTERYAPSAFVGTINSAGCAECKDPRCELVSRTHCYITDPLRERCTQVCS